MRLMEYINAVRECFMMRSKDLTFRDVALQGKYPVHQKRCFRKRFLPLVKRFETIHKLTGRFIGLRRSCKASALCYTIL
ncbi:MAG: hypothetical protein ACLSFI_03385 [Christensenellaceae bacterium]